MTELCKDYYQCARNLERCSCHLQARARLANLVREAISLPGGAKSLAPYFAALINHNQ
jgi:hypothetical protein